MISVFGQTQKTKCFALRIAKKKYLQDTSLLQPKLQLQGFYILQNGVYYFVVANKTYNYQRVFEIYKDSIYVGYAFDTVPTLIFSIIDDFSIRLFTCYDGRCGFPNYITIKRNKYIFEIIEPDNYCLLPAK